MEETGGTVEDYVRLNADYENVDMNPHCFVNIIKKQDRILDA